MMENSGIYPPRHRGSLTTEFYALSPNPFSLLRLMKSARKSNEPIFKFRHMLKSTDVQLLKRFSFTVLC